MSIFAGIYLKDRNAPIPDADRDALIAAVARAAGSAPAPLGGPGFLIAKINIGAHPGEGFRKAAEGDASALAGNPVLDVTDGCEGDRDRELAALAAGLDKGDGSVAARSRGSFTAAHFRARDHELHLLADRGATKPLYY